MKNKRKINFSNEMIDLSMRDAIVNDMLTNKALYHPDPHWEKAEKYLIDYFSADGDFFSNHMFEDKHRLGSEKRSVADFDKLELSNNYENWMDLPFSRAIDHTNKIVDIYLALNKSKNGKVYVIEVGGGYGRTALFLLNYFGPRVCYVNVDAVPSSIIVSEQFLRHNCRSDLVIGGYSDVQNAKMKGNNLNIEYYNYISVPAWDIDMLPSDCFDVAMNIWSMQEMSIHHEKLYFELWNRVCKKDAILYFLNVNKRNFQHGYHFPKEWIFLYEGKEYTYGNPERFFILNPSSEMVALKKKYQKGFLSWFCRNNKPLVKDNFNDVTPLLSKDIS